MAQPWLTGLDGTSTWTTKPSTQHTIPTSVTHDASSLIQKSSRSQRRSLSGNSISSLKKPRSPLAPLDNNENSSIRRNDKSMPSDDAHGTVQLRSKSSSPAKKTASLEWRKRLLHGKVAYGDQTDLFGPSGLDNIFAKNEKRPNGSGHRAEASLGWIPKSDATMPSSPPPWPTKDLLERHQGVSTPNSASLPRSRQSSHLIDGSPASDAGSSSPSVRSDPFNLQLSEPDERGRENADEDNAVAEDHDANPNRTLGVMTELEQEGFSPVFVSKHTTINGKVDYAAINSDAMKELRQSRVQEEPDSEDVSLSDKQVENEVVEAEESVFTDGSESKLQTGFAQDLSLSENLPTGTPEPFGRFVQVQRGGYSVIGSFRHRPLSAEPSPANEIVNDDSEAILPSAPTPPLTAAGSSTTATLSKREAPSTPLKLFAAYDTFTSNRLLHRMTELDDEVGSSAKVSTAAPEARRQVSFGDGKLNDAQFETTAEIRSDPASSPASDVPVPGSRIPFNFRKDSTDSAAPELSLNPRRLQSMSKRARISSEASDVEPKAHSEHKRPPASPLKNSTPKRRRTLHASELIDHARASTQQASKALQESVENAKASPTPQKTTSKTAPDVVLSHAVDAIDASLREATDDFLAHEDPSIVDDILEQAEQSLSDSNPATIRERAEVVAGEVAKYTLRVNKADDRDEGGMRKPSVTTADFFREAECVMEYIRARAAKKKSMLASVEETQNEETFEPDQSLLVSKGPARIESHMRISREPSWEDRPRSGWREPEQQRVQKSGVSMNRVASQLRRWREPDALEEHDVFLPDSEIKNDHDVDDGPQSSEVVYDQHAQIRITGPSSEYKHPTQDDQDSRPSSQRSAQSSNETTRRTENVGTLAPSAVAHLIGSEVGGMTFDREKQQWVRTRHGEHKPDTAYLNVHESHITSEDDPFREISDLVVDEGVEKRRISSPARMLDTKRPEQLLPAPALVGLPLNTRPASFHSTRSPERQLSISETVLHPQHDASDQTQPQLRESDVVLSGSGQDGSTKSTLTHATTIASDERISRVIDDADAAVEAEHEFITAQRVAHGTTTSAPEMDYLSRCQDEEDVEDINPSELVHSAQPLPSNHKPVLYDSKVPVLPQPRSNHGLMEQSEVSFTAPLSGDRMISVSLSVSKPVVPPSRQTEDLASSPLRHMSTMMLSDLPDFTVHDEDAERPSETAMAQRFVRYAAAEAKDRFALATKEVTKALTDLHPNEPYWDELQKLDLSKQFLTSLHGLESYCSGVRHLNVSSNKLTHLEGAPASVRQLSARANNLSSLTQFSHLYNLQYLDVSRNNLESLAALAGCIHLRELKADDNLITDLEPLSSSGLLKLRCRRNQIHKLDFAQDDFQSLSELDLCSNGISTLTGLQYLTSLETLNLSGNTLKEGFPKIKLPNLRRLMLRNCGLTTLNVSLLPALEVLDVDDNCLRTIEGLNILDKLQVLSIRRQRLDEGVFVDVFGKPLEAHTVRLSGNILPRLVVESANFSLRHLELSGVGLTELPEGFGVKMSNIRTLNLNSNNIKDIRPLLHMKALQKLQISGNRLSRLRKNAAVLGHLPSLSSIDLRDNPITQGFYNSMASSTCRGVTDLVRHSVVEDDLDQARGDEKTERLQYDGTPREADEDAKHLLRLDEETKLRRRVYEILLAHSCKQLKALDGLPFAKAKAVQKDHIWDRLLALGVVRKSSTTAV